MDGIIKEQARVNVKFELAKQIRGMLDEAKIAYEKANGRKSWEEDDVENEVVELVTGEDK